MSIKWVCIGGPYGDCTSRYVGEIGKGMTVKEFLDRELDPREWGIIQIDCGTHMDIVCRYSGKKLIEVDETLLNRYLFANITEVRASGGWSLMDYTLDVEESDTEPKEKVEPLKLKYKDGFDF